MTKRVEKAMELHKKGYNCAQAVACSFCVISCNGCGHLVSCDRGFWWWHGRHERDLRCHLRSLRSGGTFKK